MACDFKLEHGNGEWVLGGLWSNRWRDGWLRIYDREWPLWGKRNYEAILMNQKCWRQKVEHKRNEVQGLLDALGRIRKVEVDNPGIMQDIAEILAYAGEEPMGGFRQLWKAIEEEKPNLGTKVPHASTKTIFKGWSGPTGLSLREWLNLCIDELSELDYIIGKLESLGEKFFDTYLSEEPPLLPFLRGKQMFEKGAAVRAWLDEDPDGIQQLKSNQYYPYLTKVIEWRDDENVILESRYTADWIDIYSSRIMLETEYEYYLDHAAYRNFLIEKMCNYGVFRERLKDVDRIDTEKKY